MTAVTGLELKMGLRLHTLAATTTAAVTTTAAPEVTVTGNVLCVEKEPGELERAFRCHPRAMAAPAASHTCP